MIELNPITITAIIAALIAAGVGAYAAYKYGGQKVLQAFLTKLFIVVDAIWRAVDQANRTPGLSKEAKLSRVMEVALATASAQGVGNMLSRDLLLKIVEGSVTLTKRYGVQSDEYVPDNIPDHK